MPRKKSTKSCNCIDQANKQLKQYNTYIPRELSLDFKTGKSQLVLMVPSAKIDPKKRGQAKSVIAAHCPACGKKFA